MPKMNFITGDTIDGHKVSPYGLSHGYVDYATLSKCFDHVYSESIMTKAQDWELVNGFWEDEEGYIVEVFQTYIISEYGANLLAHMTDELVEYSAELDMYVWHVTHWGTSWDYVLTDIKTNVGYASLDTLPASHA